MENLTFENSSQLVAGNFNAKGIFRYKNGFTLVEILVVVTIIALLVSIAMPQLAAYKIRANNGTCGADLRSLATAMEAYYVDNSTYATATLGGLTTSYSFLQTKAGGGNACNVKIINQTRNAWTGTSQWTLGLASDGTMVHTWNSAGGGMQNPVAL